MWVSRKEWDYLVGKVEDEREMASTLRMRMEAFFGRLNFLESRINEVEQKVFKKTKTKK